MKKIEGWIYAIYFKGEKTFVWVKTQEHKTVMLRLNYTPLIYAKHDKSPDIYHEDIVGETTVKRRINSTDKKVYPVFKISTRSPKHFQGVRKYLLANNFELFNSDLNMRQKFFLDTESAPFLYSRITVDIDETFTIEVLEKPGTSLSRLPDFSFLKLTPKIKSPPTRFPTMDDTLEEMELQFSTSHDTDLLIESIDTSPLNTALRINETHPSPASIEHFRLIGTEQDILERLFQLLQDLDPDFLLVKNGDNFNVPFLYHRAKENQLEDFYLGRIPSKVYKTGNGQSFVTYGAIQYKSAPLYLPGRVYIDVKNSFFVGESGLWGVLELSRMSGVPADRCARNSIGTVLTAIECRVANESHPQILIPEGKARSEQFKESLQLLSSDSGGLTYPATPGIYDQVWGIDFTSLYPSIMMKHNIGNETVLCDCCSQTSDITVPETAYHICQKQTGIVPEAMRVILRRRMENKFLKLQNIRHRRAIKGSDSALKWILVACFGYLGFKNSRWGSIESHQAVTAYARHYLIFAKTICEREGYRVVAGLTDSLFIQAVDPQKNSITEVEKLVYLISKETGFSVSIDGCFNWIVFCHIKNFSNIAALTRYFGAYDSGKYKIRGIESRKRSTAKFIAEFQEELLTLFLQAKDKKQFIHLIPTAEKILDQWIKELYAWKIPTKKLYVRYRSGKGARGYKFKTLQALAAERYNLLGRVIEPGQNMKFIVVNNLSKSTQSIRIEDEEIKTIDFQWYEKLLKNAYLDLVETVINQEKSFVIQSSLLNF